ncbi:MAG: cupredoxin family copper-binding protein [Solirubrobacterales bacterium]
MKGAGALASGMLVLAAICAVPAVSAAQDADVPADTTTTDTTAEVTTTTPEATTAAAPDPVAPTADASATTTPAPPAVTVTSPSGEARTAASASVTIGDFFFSPASVTVAVGDTVTWRNSGQAPHNATANDGSFKTPDLGNGQSASHTFSQPGTFSYICTIHPNMHGTVRVLSSSGGSGKGGGSGSSSGSSSTGSATSESSAVASPDAAGTSATLPMTGMAVGALALVGLVMLALGLIARRASDRSAQRSWLTIF